ncbi:MULTISPECIES: hypothetical protein [unclassified Pedobacter]|uniref:hypothetical protein n=1 Tax=unclassified Pedobacter TaxID=2628915 RepID=UPI001E622AA4|nr:MULTISPECIES: hypothetical protein [unclassified Pedobacter]
MSISELVRNAILKGYTMPPANALAAVKPIGLKNSVDHFIAQLQDSGAKVFLNSYYFSNAFGPVSARLLGKTRRQIRKSLAFLRVRKFVNCNFRAKLGVAACGAIFISKQDMILLQLTNECRFASLYIDANDVLSDLCQANVLIEQYQQSDGYYVSGPNRLAHSPLNELRNIPRLVVYISKKQKRGPVFSA